MPTDATDDWHVLIKSTLKSNSYLNNSIIHQMTIHFAITNWSDAVQTNYQLVDTMHLSVAQTILNLMIYIQKSLFTVQNMDTSKHRTETQIWNYKSYHMKT
jgi:hypothetical protein